MGCKGSKEAVEEENREDGAPGSAGLANEATKGPETKHVRQLRLDNGAAAADENMNKVRKEKKAEKANEIAQTDSKPSLVMNAWDAPRAGKAGQLEKIENVPKGPTQEELLRDMEFDKEGIDLCSSAIDGGARPPTPLHKSLLKDESEIFDPSRLIDMEKFKAANAPARGQPRGGKNASGALAAQEHPPGPLPPTDTSHSSAVSSGQTNGLSSAQLASPSLDEFYDEDEKELMASIEKAFPDPQAALPGAVG